MEIAPWVKPYGGTACDTRTGEKININVKIDFDKNISSRVFSQASKSTSTGSKLGSKMLIMKLLKILSMPLKLILPLRMLPLNIEVPKTRTAYPTIVVR